MNSGIQNFSFQVRCILMTAQCPPNKLERYRAINLFEQFCGIVKIMASLSVVVFSLKSKKPSDIHLSDNVSVLLLAIFEYGHSFYARYRNMSLK